MRTITAGQAQSTLSELLNEAAASHEPIYITGDTTSAVLVSEDGCRSVEETLYLLSMPGLREAIREGMRTPPEECPAVLPW